MRTRDWLTAGASLLALFVAVMVLGGALRWTQAVVAVLVALALAANVLSRRGLARPSPLVVLLLVAAGVTALQLVPLGGLVDGISPTASGLREDGLGLLDLPVSTTATMDEPGTLQALVFFLVLLAVAAIVLRVAVTERGRFRVVAAVTGLCGLVAATVWAHELFDAHSLFGIYTPTYAAPHMLGPLLNLNHLGCLMAVGSVAALGLVMYRRQPTWLRVVWVGVIAGCGSVTVSTVSRGATLALGVGALVAVGVLLAQRFTNVDPNLRRKRGSFITSSLPIAIVCVCTVVVVIYSSAGNVQRELSRLSMQDIQNPRTKFAAWRSAEQLLEESPWLGIGRGAFESVFTRVHPTSGLATYSHVENEYIQSAVDWGIPAAILLGLCGLWLGVTAVRRWRDGPVAAAALGGLTVVAVQSNVDFGIELLGIAVPATALAATVAYVPLRELEQRARTWVRALRVAHVAALAVGAALLLSPLTTSLEEDRSRIREMKSPTLAELRDAIERHPLDYYPYATAAEVLLPTNPQQGIRVLNHALRLHPSHPGLHVMAARALYRRGFVDQAAGEYSQALRSTGVPQKLLREIATLFSPQQAAAAIPADFPSPMLIVAALGEMKRPAIVKAWLARLLQLRPRDNFACMQLFTVAVTDSDLDAANTAKLYCPEAMLDLPMQLQLAQMYLQQKTYDEVIRILADVERWEGRIDVKVTAWLVLCDAYIAQSRWDEAKRCLRRLDVTGYLADRPHEIAQRFETISNSRK